MVPQSSVSQPSNRAVKMLLTSTLQNDLDEITFALRSLKTQTSEIKMLISQTWELFSKSLSHTDTSAEVLCWHLLEKAKLDHTLLII